MNEVSHVLLLVFKLYGYGGAASISTTTIQFPTQVSCEQAAREIIKIHDDTRLVVRGSCVPMAVGGQRYP